MKESPLTTYKGYLYGGVYYLVASGSYSTSVKQEYAFDGKSKTPKELNLSAGAADEMGGGITFQGRKFIYTKSNTGLWVYDFKTGKTQRVVKGSDYYFSAMKGNLLFYGKRNASGLWMYDLKKKRERKFTINPIWKWDISKEINCSIIPNKHQVCGYMITRIKRKNKS